MIVLDHDRSDISDARQWSLVCRFQGRQPIARKVEFLQAREVARVLEYITNLVSSKKTFFEVKLFDLC